MLIHSIHLNHFLSFGDSPEGVRLGPLNLIIGPNGAGKSNLLKPLHLLQSAPDQLMKSIREGGVRDWLYKGGSSTPVAALDVVLDNPKGPQPLRYCLKADEVGQRFQITDERIENEKPASGKNIQVIYYHFNSGRPEAERERPEAGNCSTKT